MFYTSRYSSPLGGITVASDSVGLTGLWFDGQKYFSARLSENCIEKEMPVHTETKRWLDKYFSGSEPDCTPPLHLIGSDFQIDVWNILLTIPFGKTVTYGEVAALTAKKRGLARMSAQAVGGAVGHNNISLIVPCHRVIGANGNLTGYAGGMDKKIALLRIENGWSDEFFVPKKHPKDL